MAINQQIATSPRGWVAEIQAREVSAAPTAPHYHLRPTGEELAGGSRLCSQHRLDGEQLDTRSSLCHSHGVAEVNGCIAFKGKAFMFPCAPVWAGL